MKLSPLEAAVTSAAENGVQTRMDTRTWNTWSATAATIGFAGAGKNSAKANVSLASPRRDDGCEESRSGTNSSTSMSSITLQIE